VVGNSETQELQLGIEKKKRFILAL
jgi:hypothetical protein